MLCRDSWPPDEKILIQSQRWGLTTWSFLCSKVLLKYNRDRESFWQTSEGNKRSAPLLVFTRCFTSVRKLVSGKRDSSTPRELHQAPPTTCSCEIGSNKVYHPPALNQLTWILVCWAIISPRLEKRKKRSVLGRTGFDNREGKKKVCHLLFWPSYLLPTHCRGQFLSLCRAWPWYPGRKCLSVWVVCCPYVRIHLETSPF